MTVAMVVPFTGKRMVEVPARQRYVSGEQIYNLHQQCIEFLSVLSRFFSPVIAPEASSVFNLPHSDFAADYPACRP